jgi:nucleotide-binding universal stress UspA family protein
MKMFRSIQVLSDGSLFSEHALPLAASLAQREGVTLQFVRVYEPIEGIYLHRTGPFAADLDRETMIHVRRQLEMTATNLTEKTGLRPLATLLKGPVAESIIEHASASAADLLVMTTHGRGPLSRIWFGSIADSLVRQSSIPILLVRPQTEAPTYDPLPTVRRILIPLDGSELSEQAIEPALSLLNAETSELTLVRATPKVMATMYDSVSGRSSDLRKVWLEQLQGLKRELETEAQDYLERIASRLRTGSLKVNTYVIDHDRPAAAILEAASRFAVDAIALTTRGHGRFKRLLLGSVTDKVVRGATMPVLICPPVENPVRAEGIN